MIMAQIGSQESRILTRVSKEQGFPSKIGGISSCRWRLDPKSILCDDRESLGTFGAQIFNDFSSTGAKFTIGMTTRTLFGEDIFFGNLIHAIDCFIDCTSITILRMGWKRRAC